MTAEQITPRLWITSRPALPNDDSLEVSSVISLEDVAQFPAGFANYCLAKKNTAVQLGTSGSAIIRNSCREFKKDGCMVSYFSLPENRSFTIALFGVQADQPLLPTKAVLHELYESYKRTLKKGVTLIHAADPVHAEHIILTFLFFEARWYIKKEEEFRWCKEAILDDLNKSHPNKFKNKEQIRQAETNASDLYQYIFSNREIKSTANKLLTYQSAHLCALPKFSAWFNKKEQKKQKKSASALTMFTPKTKVQEEKQVIKEGRRCCTWFGC